MKRKNQLVLLFLMLPLILSGCGKNNNSKPNTEGPNTEENSNSGGNEGSGDSGNTEDNKEETEVSKKDFENIKFEDKSITFDNETHTLEATNVPEGATIAYTNAGPFKNVGNYKIKVKITKEGYNDLEKEATLTIVKATHASNKYSLESLTIDEDKTDHIDDIKVKGDLTTTSTVTTTVSKNGKEVSEAIEPGVYNYEVKITDTNYNDVTLKATLTINKVPVTEAEFKEAFSKYIKTECESNVDYNYKITRKMQEYDDLEDVETKELTYDSLKNTLYYTENDGYRIKNGTYTLKNGETIHKYEIGRVNSDDSTFSEITYGDTYISLIKESNLTKLTSTYSSDNVSYMTYDLDNHLEEVTRYQIDPKNLDEGQTWNFTFDESNGNYHFKLEATDTYSIEKTIYIYEMYFDKNGVSNIFASIEEFQNEERTMKMSATLDNTRKKNEVLINSFTNFNENSFHILNQDPFTADFDSNNNYIHPFYINEENKITLIKDLEKYSSDLSYDCYLDTGKTRKIDLSTYKVPCSDLYIIYDLNVSENKALTEVNTSVILKDDSSKRIETKYILTDTTTPFSFLKSVDLEGYDYDLYEVELNYDYVVDELEKPKNEVNFESKSVNELNLTYKFKEYPEVSATYEEFNSKFMDTYSKLSNYSTDFTITKIWDPHSNNSRIQNQVEYDNSLNVLNGITRGAVFYTAKMSEDKSYFTRREKTYSGLEEITYTNANFDQLINAALRDDSVFPSNLYSKSFRSYINSIYRAHSVDKSIVPDVSLTEEFTKKGNELIFKTSFSGHRYQRMNMPAFGNIVITLKPNSDIIFDVNYNDKMYFSIEIKLKNEHTLDEQAKLLNNEFDNNLSKVIKRNMSNSLIVKTPLEHEILYINKFDGNNFSLPPVFSKLPEGLTFKYALDSEGSNLIDINNIQIKSPVTTIYVIPEIPQGKFLVLNNIYKGDALLNSYFELIDVPTDNNYAFKKQIIDDKGSLQDPKYIYHYEDGEITVSLTNKNEYYVSEGEFYMFRYELSNY